MLGGKTHHIRGGAHSSTDVFCFCVRKLTPHRLAVELLLWFRRGQLRRKHSPADFSTKTAAWRSTRYEYSTGAPSAQKGERWSRLPEEEHSGHVGVSRVHWSRASQVSHSHTHQ